MKYSIPPGAASNCHPKSEPQNSRPFAVSSAGISKCTNWPAIGPPLASGPTEASAPAAVIQSVDLLAGWNSSFSDQAGGPAGALDRRSRRTAGQVVVHQAAGLHERVERRGANEAKAPALELTRERHGLRRRR